MTVELSPDDATDPGLSPLRNFGNEVMLERMRMNMSRVELGRAVACGESLVAKIERGDRVPQREFAEGCDRVFPHGNGRFMRLWRLALRYAYPPWFRPYVALEEKATALRMFNPVLVPGIVQTRGYATAILKEGRPMGLEDLVTSRLERQRILEREEPPRLWLVLHERVLRNVVGTEEVMREQLVRLLQIAETPTHRVQIIRDDGRQHGPVGSPFVLMSFDEGADVVHVDGFPRGYVLAEQEDVTDATDAYDLLRAFAMPLDESAELINSVLRDCYS
ncbi:helix-turn-helix transcriptional regulator [Streptomyces sp. CAI-21]|uniref:Scr1 family TA system antitoxin-like transcriptional regulator n=1 Tax=Streptomyces TaxID=1883 RepID=UPI0015873DB4|nr:helix-turn-helix transcriptional regulator [Streptomyces sampsonii]NUW09390.1 helix-turn-helix transcriptional regulator [Streptomyces sp. CAI-21]NVI32143.1 helix-turn-helix transcriptional regulator [Streptomyces sp. CAI-17]